MYAITYRSKAYLKCTPEEILDILSASKRNNKKCDITGCLLYHKNSFIQILEGNKNEVKKTFAKIIEDQRHTDVTLLWGGSCEKRAFPDWNMAYHSLETTNDAKAISEFEQNLLFLSSYSKKDSASIMLFWKNLEKLIVGEPISSYQNNNNDRCTN